MINIIARYRVKRNKISKVKRAIKEFVKNIKKKEKGTLKYGSFQFEEDPAEFMHFMMFKDRKSEELHRKTEYVKKFVNVIYPVCERKPFFIRLSKIN